jgi:hypothetical protein
MTIQIPNTPKEISPDWLNRTLAEGGYLGSSRVERISTAMAADQGMTSVLVRVSMELDKAVSAFPKTLMVKLRPESDEVFDRCRTMGVYNREIGFYRDIPDPGLSVPACYYAAEDS